MEKILTATTASVGNLNLSTAKTNIYIYIYIYIYILGGFLLLIFIGQINEKLRKKQERL
jgi:hypothetical protein